MMSAFLIVGVAVGAVAFVIAEALLRGWALSIMWGWFAVPLFHLPPLGIAQAMGVSLVIGMLCHQYVPSKEGDAWTAVITVILSPFVVLLIGYVVKGYM